MQAQLIVKNFGPIEDVDLDLRNVNVFIGPQASGKSALAKIYTICKSPLSFYDDGTNKNLNGLYSKLSNIDRFKKMLEDYNVGSFLNDDTYIFFSSELHDFVYSKEGIKYDRKIFKKIGELEKLSEDLEGNKEKLSKTLSEFHDKFFFFSLFLRMYFREKKSLSSQGKPLYLPDENFTQEQLVNGIQELKNLESGLSNSLALYIPAERNFVSIIKGAALNLQNNEVPIPKHILSFGAEVEKASYKTKYIDLNFLKKGLVYKNENGQDKIYFSENNSIKLTEAASGLQSVIPLLLPIISKRGIDKLSHKSFVIEEPELNLFPKAQYELIKILEKDRTDAFFSTQDMGTIHTYTTHSPYVLSAFNNLLYATKVTTSLLEKKDVGRDFYETYRVIKDSVEHILPVDIHSEYFSAYQICDGKAQSIFNREKGLIEDNYIDEVTDKMGDDFDALMELMEEA